MSLAYPGFEIRDSDISWSDRNGIVCERGFEFNCLFV